MLTRIIFITLFLGLLQFSGLHAEDFNPVVGKTNGFALREADVDRLIGYQSPEAQATLKSDPVRRAEFVRQLLLTRLVADEARKSAFDKSPEEREKIGYAIDQFIAADFLNKVVAADVTVSETELNRYYDANKKEFIVPLSVRARHIFIEAANDPSPELKKKARSKAEEILDRLRNGGDFAELAKEFSQDAGTAAKGGDLGWISPGKTNSPEFEEALFGLKAGETSGIVETPFGFHIVRIDERKEERTASFDEARGYILAKLKGELERRKVSEYLEKLSKDAGLEVMGAKKGAVEGK